mgnify:CR=1 FL=1
MRELYCSYKEQQGGEKLIFYKTEVSEHQEIRVRAEFEGDPEPEQIKQISEVVKKAAEEIGKIVEEW